MDGGAEVGAQPSRAEQTKYKKWNIKKKNIY